MNFKSIFIRQYGLDRRSWIIISVLIISVLHTRIVEPAIRADARDYVLYAYNPLSIPFRMQAL